jgi:hypothetical protein
VYPEQQWYLPSQDQVFGGALHLAASPIPTAGTNAQGQPETYQCRSGIVTTGPSFNFTYGYVEIVARLPKDPNAWPALWMLPSNLATDLPEIDMMEMLGKQTDRPLVTFHPSSGPQQQLAAKTVDLSSGWHTFELDWEPGSLTWYIDGNAVFGVTSKVPDEPMYILANLAITDVVHLCGSPARALLPWRSVLFRCGRRRPTDGAGHGPVRKGAIRRRSPHRHGKGGTIRARC